MIKKFFSISQWVSVLCLFTVTFTVQSQITNRIYTFGNSVTDGINFAGFQAIANQRGNSHIFGRHMIPGTPLFLLYNSTSSGFSESPFGYWPTALANYDWDCISFQPFDRDVTGAEGDFTTIEKWVNYIKANRSNVNQLQTYIYSRYPRTINSIQNPNDPALTASLWNDLWLGNTAQGQNAERKAYFERLLTTFRGANLLPKQPAIVPVGDVMYALNNKMVQGRLSGYSAIWQFYSDGIHVNNVGSFTLGATFFATMYKQDPRGITVPTQYGSIPNAIRDTILQTIYEVVFTHPFSGTSLADIVPPSSVTISPKNNSLSFLQSVTLVPTVSPANASNKNVSWTSNNTSVATVDSKGKVTGVGSGVATVTGVTNVGGFSDFAVVTVSGLANFTSVTGILQAWDFAAKPNTATGFNATFARAGINTLGGVTYATIGEGLRIRSDGFGNGALMASSQDTKDLASAIGAGEYYTFSIKPDQSKLININKISFATKSEGGGHRYYLMSSIRGFNQNQILGTVTGGFNQMNAFTITGHENLSQTVEFRIYVHGDASNSGFSGVGIGEVGGNDIIIEGAVITPIDTEKPSTVPGVVVSQITDKGFFLSWNESTDNMIVMGYNVYLNGNKLNNSLLQETTFQVTSLTSGLLCNVSVTAVDFVGNESNPTVLQTITNRAPTAVLTVDKTRGAVPLTVNVNGLSSTDPDGSTGDFVLGYDIDFGNNTPVINANSGTYTYTAPGVYTISLVVVDTRNLRSTAVTALINVTAPGSDITAPSTPNGVFVTNNQSTQAVITWGTSTDNVSVAGYNVYKDGVRLNPTLVLANNYTLTGLTEAGLYTVSVTALDTFGNESAASTLSFTTNRRPIAAFTGSLVGSAPFSITLDGSTSTDPDAGDIVTDYLWTINGVNYSGKLLNVTLTSVGSLPSSLRVRSQNGDLSTVVSFVVTVNSIPVSGISVSQTSVSIPALQSTQLSASITPSNATNKNISWISSNPSVASVDATGRLTALSVGTAIVTVTSQDGNFRATSGITITSALNTSLNTGTLAGWDFNGMPRTLLGMTKTATATTYLTGVSTVASSLVATIASGLSGNGNMDNSFPSGNQTAATLAEAISMNEYFSFSVAPQVGSQLNISQVRFAPNSQSKTRTFVLMSNVAGFTIGNEIGSVGSNFWCCGNGTLASFNLSGHSNITSTVEFRVYVFTPSPQTPNQFEAVHIGPAAGADFLIIGSVSNSNDTQNPTAPASITTSNVGNTSLVLNWAESTDDIAVVGYNIYRSGVKLNATPVNALSYSLTGLTSGTTYPVTVTAVDIVGKESAPATSTVSTNNNPTAVINGLLSGTAPFTVTLSGAASSDADAGDAVVGYSWNFGNGASAIGASQSYTFAQEGVYPVSLTVSDSRGGVSSAATVNVTVTAPVDVVAPTKPGTPTGRWVSGSSNQITWGSSFDMNPIQYIIYVNSVSVATVSGTTYLVTGLNSAQSNNVAILARDMAGNTSGLSDIYNITPVTLNVSPGSLNFNATGGIAQITITSNINWNVAGLPAWASVSAANGNADAIVDLTVSANNSVNSRNAQLTILGTQFVDIAQAGAAPTLSVNSQILTVNGSGGSNTITISSNDSWVVEDDLSWISFNISSATGNGSISVIVANNTSTDSRTGTFSVIGLSNGLTRVISVSQIGVIASLSLSPSTLNFPVSVTSRTVNISSNTAWSVATEVDWIVLSTASGTGNAALSISVLSFVGTINRVATVTVSGGNLSRTIVVTQIPVKENEMLTVNSTNFTFAGTGGIDSLLITSNTNWTITGMPAWISVPSITGTKSATLKLMSETNPDTTEREGVLIIQSQGIKLIVNIKQAKGDRVNSVNPFDNESVVAYPNPVSGTLLLSKLAKVELRDSFGQILLKTNTLIDRIDMNAYPTGMYLLIIDGQRPLKITKN